MLRPYVGVRPNTRLRSRSSRWTARAWSVWSTGRSAPSATASPSAAQAATPGLPSASPTRRTPWAARLPCSPTCPRSMRHALPARSCGWGGAPGLNSTPQEAWPDLDLRSEDPKALAQLDVTVGAALDRALDDENRRRAPGTPPLRLERQPVGDRPSGITPRTHPLVQAAVAANRVLGRDAELASASTDANVPIALGIPAIALGAGGKAGDAHLATEWYENTEGALGIVRALLVTAAMAGVAQQGDSRPST